MGQSRALAGLLLIAAGGLAAACSRPEPLPSPAVLRARGALRRARIEAAGLAPAELARAVAASVRLERRLAEARADRFAPSSEDEVERLSAAAEAAAVEALATARREGVRRHAELDARRGDLARRLAALDVYLDRSPADQGLREPAGHARLELDLAAGALGGRGDLASAAARLAAASADLDSLEGRLGERYARLRDPAFLGRWQSWADAAVAASREGGAAIVVDKLRGRCRLLRGGRVAADFPADLGRNGLAEKLYGGDEATPEGRYLVTAKRDGGDTEYHRALMLDYPTADDLRRYADARRRGLVPAGRGAGSGIEIHGKGGRGVNWTNGCVALRDGDMDRLFASVEVGTPVVIVGTALLPGPPDPAPPAEARR